MYEKPWNENNQRSTFSDLLQNVTSILGNKFNPNIFYSKLAELHKLLNEINAN